MNKPSSKPAVASAVEFVKELIDTKKISGGRLPGIRQLASMAGVSRATQWKALQQLRADGLIQGDRYRRFLITGAPVQSPPVQRIRSRWEKVKEELQRDLLKGVFPPGSLLPRMKELQDRYGVSYRPLFDALNWLCDRSFLSLHKKRYKAPVLTSLHSNARIVLLTYNEFSYINLGSHLSLELNRVLEQECVRHQLPLDIYTYNMTEDGELVITNVLTGKRERSLDQSGVLGYIVLTVTLPEILDKLLFYLSKLKRPVAAIDESGGLDDVLLRKRPVPYASFQIAIGPVYGEHVGRYLLGHGHQKIAYISTFHDTVWSMNRYQGLRTVFSAAGHTDGVSLYIGSRARQDYEFIDDLVANHNLEPFLMQCDTLDKKMGQRYEQGISRLRDLVVRRYIYSEIERQFEPIFERILLDKTITAWVGGNDNTAIAALKFLRRKGVQIPQRLSIVGYDDLFDAYANGLTTYNFCIPAVISQVIQYILRPHRSHSKMPLHRSTEGLIIERMTCGPALRQKADRP